MSQQFTLGVYRWLQPDPTEDAQERHVARQQALHEALTHDEGFEVASWGATDDTQPHEFVEVVALVTPVAAAAAWTVIQWLGKKLVEKAVDEGIAHGFQALVTRLRGAQDSKKVQDFFAVAHDGTRVEVFPSALGGQVTITFADGTQAAYSPPD
jgi:hypothetical protein